MAISILYRKICHKTGESFTFEQDTPFTMPLHSHEDYELIYIISGTGKEYIGDTVIDYEPGVMTLIGSNVPHLHLCDSCTGMSNNKSSCHLLQFPLKILPLQIDEIQELNNINLMLQESAAGIRFKSKETVYKTLSILSKFNKAQGTERIILLYKILDILSKCPEKNRISPIKYQTESININDPIERIYAYLKKNFRKEIDLNKVSTHIGQNPSSVCRLFKQKTGKTIFTILNEIRIEYASKLLAISNLTNAQIAYECGFNNISYFNKVFKLLTGQTPTAYKNNLQSHPIIKNKI